MQIDGQVRKCLVQINEYGLVIMSLSTLFKLYQDDGKMIMKGSVQ